MFRYWKNLLRIAAIDSAALVGIGHPNRWPIPIAVWLLTTYLAFRVLGNPQDVADGGIIALCGFAAAGIIFIVLVLARLLTLPPALDAAATARIGHLTSILNSPKPALGPIICTIEQFAEIAAEQADSASINDVDLFHTLVGGVQQYLANTLIHEWIECFNREFAGALSGNIDPIYYFGRLADWLSKCANRLDEDDLLPIPSQSPAPQV